MAEAGAPLGIIAGGGDFPLRLARAAEAAGRPVFVVGIEGWADPIELAGVPHVMERLGAAGSILDHMRRHQARDLVLAGRARRPSIASLRPDAFGVKVLGRLGRAVFAGDDGLLQAIVRVLGEEGFAVLPVQAVVHDILPGAGPLTLARPDAEAEADIARGIAVARALGLADVGQGCVVQQGLVLTVEAIEGTDAMLARAGELRREGAGGVLVKLVKPGQDRRVDLPAIGPRTVRGAIAAGLRGIAIEARGTVVVDRAELVAEADAAGLFVVAIDPDQFPQG